MTSQRSRALRTSSLVQPSTSRSEITARWFGGSSSIAAAITSRVSAASSRSSGRSRGGADQAPGWAGRRAEKRSGSTAASGTRAGSCSAENGQRAALALRPGLRGVDEDPEDPGLERRAALEAVERAEHAQPRLLHDLLGDRRLGVKIRATRRSGECHSRTSSRKVSSSPARRAATSSSSVRATVRS